MLQGQEKESVLNVSKLALWIFIPLLVIVSGLTFLIYQLRAREVDRLLYEKQMKQAEFERRLLLMSMEPVFSDLGYLARQSQMESLFTAPSTIDSSIQGDLTRDFADLVQARGIYDRLQLIDRAGNELIRIDYRDGRAQITPENGLQSLKQNKSFEAAVKLGKGKAYLGSLQPDLEQDRTATRQRLVLPLAVPFFDDVGGKRGVLILTLAGDYLFNKFEQVPGVTGTERVLLNEAGDALTSQPPDSKWGLMNKGGKRFNFGVADPVAWDRIEARSTGHFSLHQGHFVFTTAYLLPMDPEWEVDIYALAFPQEHRPLWKIVTLLPTHLIKEERYRATAGLAWTYGISIVLLALLSMLLAGAIGSRRRAEHAVRERERRYSQLFEDAPVGYQELDRQGRIVRVNQTGLDMMGYSAEEMIGRYSWDFILEKESLQKLFEADLRNDHLGKGRFEHTRIRKDGTTFSSLSESRILRDEAGRVLGFRTTFQDITEHKRMQAQFLATRKAEAVTVLAGGIAHDFNNLLSIVYGYLGLAQMDIESGQDATDLLKKAEQGILDAKDLTSRMIQLTGGAGSARSRVAIERELESWVLDTTRHYGVKAEFNFLEQLREVSIDRKQMRQAVQNIVLNAIDATPEGGVIQVEAANLCFTQPEEFPDLPLAPGDYVLLTIRDQGEGIKKELLDHVFDPYFSTKERGSQKGMGLGLAVTAAVVRKHGGSVTVESQAGKGTSFHIYLPALERSTPASHTADTTYRQPFQNVLRK